jgi:hypothetical protein
VVGVVRYYEAGSGGPESHHEFVGGDMGFSARAYWRSGGFRTLPTGDKADLVERFEAAGHRIHRHTELSVITPARTEARDLYGFAHNLRHLGRSAAGDCA